MTTPASAMACPSCRTDAHAHLYGLPYGAVRVCAGCGVAYTAFDGVGLEKTNQVFGSADYIKARYYEVFTLRRIARRRLRQLRAYLPGGDLLEFGASSGEFLYESSKRGFRVSCVDLYPTLLDVNQPARIQNVYRQDANSFAIERTFDAVAAFHVIEHLSSPAEFLTKCRQLLKPRGLLFLEVPNFGSLARRLWRGRWGMFYDYHLCHFDRGSLTSLLQRCGYTTLSVRSVDDPVRYVAPWYHPLRNALWVFIKRMSRSHSANAPAAIGETPVSASLQNPQAPSVTKTAIYRFELALIRCLSWLFLPISLSLGVLGFGSYLRVIARKA